MKNTVELPAFQALTVTADESSSGTVRRLAPSGSGTTYDAQDVAAASSVSVGPFTQSRNYEIVSDVGQLSYAVSDADPTADSAGLASSLADETGTGKAMFNNSPVVESFLEVKASESAPDASANGVRLYVVEVGGLKVLKAMFAGGSATIATDPD